MKIRGMSEHPDDKTLLAYLDGEASTKCFGRQEWLFASLLICNGFIGGPDRDRTDDLFHAMEARSQLRHRPTLRKDSLYSGGAGGIRQCLRELIRYLSVSKDNRSERALFRRRRGFHPISLFASCFANVVV